MSAEPSKTPRTDAIDASRVSSATPQFMALLDLARELERGISEAQRRADDAQAAESIAQLAVKRIEDYAEEHRAAFLSIRELALHSPLEPAHLRLRLADIANAALAKNPAPPTLDAAAKEVAAKRDAVAQGLPWCECHGPYLGEDCPRCWPATAQVKNEIFPNIREWYRSAPDAIGIRFAQDLTNEQVEAFPKALVRAASGYVHQVFRDTPGASIASVPPCTFPRCACVRSVGVEGVETMKCLAICPSKEPTP